MANHCKGLKPKTRQILANYAVFVAATPATAKNADEIISMLAKKLAKMDDFEYGDKRFESLNNKLTEVYQEKYDIWMDPKGDSEFIDGVSETLYKDASRANFYINGSDPNAGLSPKDIKGRETAVVSKFKEALKGSNEKFQKPLSMFMCQDMSRMMGELLAGRLTKLNREEVQAEDYKGGELMPLNPRDGVIFDEWGGLARQARNLSYRLELSEDKKTATITMEGTYDLKFAPVDAYMAGFNTCGSVKYSSQFKFDLSGNELNMISSNTSQHIEP